MRVGSKVNIADTKKTRSCVVRLEKLSYKSLTPKPSSSAPRRSINTSTSPRTFGGGNTLRRTSIGFSGVSKSGIMGATPKQPMTATPNRDGRNIKGPMKKRLVGGSANAQTPQQKQATTNVAASRSNQKIKPVPKSFRGSSSALATPKASPVREETPTPTIAAGRSRRAIKPNPKYASEDIITPKAVRNLAGTAASANKSSGGTDGKRRKNSTSSEDFYNRHSDYESEDEDLKNYNDQKGDKAYKVDEKESALDSDISDIEDEISKRMIRSRATRLRKSETPAATKTVNNTPNANVKRLMATPGSAARSTASNTAQSASTVRTVPTQLQQLRRSLQSANAQRNQSLLAGSGSATLKRKLADTTDSDNDTTYTVARKQMLVTNSQGQKVRVPIKESNIKTGNAAIFNKQKIMQRIANQTEGRLSLNGGNKNLNTQLIEKRRAIELTKNPQLTKTPQQESASKMSVMRTLTNRIQPSAQSTPVGSNKTHMATKPTSAQTPQQKTLSAASAAANANRLLRTSSPKPPLRKDMSSSNTTKFASTPTASASSSSSSSAQQQQKKFLSQTPTTTQTQKKMSTSPPKAIDKLKSALASSLAASPSSYTKNSKAKPSGQQSGGSETAPVKESMDLKNTSPNSTMDDFETMPTFTIVNVNDIINKKGDVLITKTKENNNSPKPTVIEFSESVSLDEDDEDEDDEDNDDLIDDNEVKKDIGKKQDKANKSMPLPTITANKQKQTPINKRVETEKKKLALTRNNTDAARKAPQKTANTSFSPNTSSTNSSKPQILNHRLGLRTNPKITAKTTAPLASKTDKPAPRILNSVVAKKTQPVKPMITNLDDSGEESFQLSLDEDETEDEAESKSFGRPQRKAAQKNYSVDLDTDDTESQATDQDEPFSPTKALTPKNNASITTNTTSSAASKLSPSPNTLRKRRSMNSVATPLMVANNKKRILTPAAAKENSLAAVNQQVNDNTTKPTATTLSSQTRRPTEKVVISKQGDKIIKKITCFETWYVINMPQELKRQPIIRNHLDIPLINLANKAKTVSLPSERWSCKVTLYELSAATLAKSTFVTFTGDLEDYNIMEEDRARYQPSSVMFRRAIENRQNARMPYDRAIIFKNKTFSTNIEGKNIRLVGAPSIINSEKDIEILLEVVDGLTLQSEFVEFATML